MMLGKEIFWEKMHLTSFDWTVKISINSLVFLCTAVNNFNSIYASFCSNSTFEVLKTQLLLVLAQQENPIRFVDSVENRFSPMFFPHLKQSENLSLFHQLPCPNSPKQRFPDPEISRLRPPPSSSFLTNPQEKKKARNPSAYAILPPRRYYHLAILSPRTPLGSRFMCISFFPGSYLHAYCFISLPNVWPVYVTRTPRQKLTVSCWVPPSRGGINSAHTTFIESVYFNPCFVSVSDGTKKDRKNTHSHGKAAP